MSDVRGVRVLRALVTMALATLLVPVLPGAALGPSHTVPSTSVPSTSVLTASVPEPVLLSQGRPAVSSSLEKADFPARQAVDGNPRTRWSSGFSDPQWLRVDLGRSTVVRRVEIVWEVSHSTAYSIEVSADGEIWAPQWSTDAADGGTDVITIDATGRFVRMYSTARVGTAGNSIWEMRVYGDPAPKKAEPEPTPSKKPAADPRPKSSEPKAEPSAPAASTPAPSESASPVPERTGPPGSVLYYVVGKEPDGTVEKLNDIAERFLDDRDRWPEIAELTEGHRQPDGKFMTDPRTLTAGWVLKMPKDASGEELKFAPLPGFEKKSQEPSASPSPSAEPTVEVAGIDEATGVGPIGPAWYAVGAGLVLAALVWPAVWLLRRRKRQEPFDDSLLRTDTSAAWTVDRSLRVLMAACERDELELPGITGVFIEGSSLRLRLTNPAAPAPEPWAVSEDGQSWAAPLARLQSGTASDGSTARFARLVNVGMSETGRVLVDFASAHGVISLDGPTRARHEVLRRWLGELTGNPWSDDPRVVMVGNGLPQPEQVEHLAGIEQVTPELEVGEGGVLVLSQAPSAAQQDMLAARFASPEFTWVVIVLGSAPSARWRFTAGDDGWLRSGFLPDVRYDEQTAIRRGGE
ncbi:discoidin domain-containing protein [Promicromonospora sp. NPDC023987]|uniref:discoidin domain-containing protein n=1 Tax=Promicromonospora sp. NPDC023987 TaxID=3155360 RepID=UPI0033EEEEE8